MATTQAPSFYDALVLIMQKADACTELQFGLFQDMSDVPVTGAASLSEDQKDLFVKVTARFKLKFANETAAAEKAELAAATAAVAASVPPRRCVSRFSFFTNAPFPTSL